MKPALRIYIISARILAVHEDCSSLLKRFGCAERIWPMGRYLMRNLYLLAVTCGDTVDLTYPCSAQRSEDCALVSTVSPNTGVWSYLLDVGNR